MAKKKAQKRQQKAVQPETASATVSAPVSIPTEAPALPKVEIKAEPQIATTKRRPISVGIWAYFIGIIVAFFAAVFVTGPMVFYAYCALAIIGIMVGILNIRDDEILLFLVASVAFVVSAFSIRTVIETAPIMSAFFANLIVFTAASAFIVSIKALIRVARDE